MATKRKEDIRITKSKRDLKRALRSILETTKFNKITIIDICDEAMINRMTFYKHYKDKTELLADLIGDELEFVRKEQERRNPNSRLTKDPGKYARELLEIIIDTYGGEDKTIINNLSSDISSLTTAITDIFFRAFMAVIEKENISSDKLIDVKLAAHYYSGGIANLLIHYVANRNDNDKEGILNFFEDQIVSFSKYFN